MHWHAQSLIPSSHHHACASRTEITHAPSSSRVLHCSTFPLLEPVHRAHSSARSLPSARTQTTEGCTPNADIYTKKHLCREHMQAEPCKNRLQIRSQYKKRVCKSALWDAHEHSTACELKRGGRKGLMINTNIFLAAFSFNQVLKFTDCSLTPSLQLLAFDNLSFLTCADLRKFIFIL